MGCIGFGGCRGFRGFRGCREVVNGLYRFRRFLRF